MRLRACSRTVSRKNLLRAGLLLWLVVPSLHAQVRHDAVVSQTNDHVSVSIQVTGVDAGELLENLAHGLTARLEFAIGVLRPRAWPFEFLGDELIREFRPFFDVKRDPFLRRFVITTHDGGRFSFVDEASMLRFFLLLPDYRIPWSVVSDRPSRPADEIALEVRVFYEPIVYAPSLGILSMFRSYDRRTTVRQRIDVGPEDGT